MLNEFRQDLVSGHWVLFSTERAKRPEGGQARPKDKFYQPKETCPFENPQASTNGPPLLVFYKGQKVGWEGEFKGDWTTQVIKNKYPALKDGLCGPVREYGPIRIADANGLIVTDI
jgi:galactose-1-phosphate uridylyltransferase